MANSKMLIGWILCVLTVGNFFVTDVSSTNYGVKGSASQPNQELSNLEDVKISEVEYVDGPLAPLYDFLIQRRLFKFCKLLRDAEVDQIISELGGSWTLFAPTDTSFFFLPEGTLEELKRNPQRLREFILYHFVVGDFPSNQIQNEMLVDSVQGSPLRFNIYGQVITVSGAQIIEPDLLFELGRVYIVDRPLYPIPTVDIITYLQTNYREFYNLLVSVNLVDYISSGGSFTLLVPEDDAFKYLSVELKEALARNASLAERILLNHILPGSLYIGGITDNLQWETVGGGLILFTTRRGLTFANDIPIVSPDINLNNGVIQVVNRVLLPEGVEADCNCKPSSDGKQTVGPRTPGGSRPPFGQPQQPQHRQRQSTQRPVQRQTPLPALSNRGQSRPGSPGLSPSAKGPWSPTRTGQTTSPPNQTPRSPFAPQVGTQPDDDTNNVVVNGRQPGDDQRKNNQAVTTRYPPPSGRHRTTTSHPRPQSVGTHGASSPTPDNENYPKQDTSFQKPPENRWSNRQPTTPPRSQTTRAYDWNQQLSTLEQPSFDTGNRSPESSPDSRPTQRPLPINRWQQRKQVTRQPIQITTFRTPPTQRTPPTRSPSVPPSIPSGQQPFDSSSQQPACRSLRERITHTNRNLPICSDSEPTGCQNAPYNPADPRPLCPELSLPECRDPNDRSNPSDNRPVCQPTITDQGCRNVNQPTYVGDRRPLCPTSIVPQSGCKDPASPFNPSDRRPVCPASSPSTSAPPAVEPEGCRRHDEIVDPQDRRPLCQEEPQEDCRSYLERPKPGDKRPICKINNAKPQRGDTPARSKQRPTPPTGRQPWQSTTRSPQSWQSTTRSQPWQSTTRSQPWQSTTRSPQPWQSTTRVHQGWQPSNAPPSSQTTRSPQSWQNTRSPQSWQNTRSPQSWQNPTTRQPIGKQPQRGPAPSQPQRGSFQTPQTGIFQPDVTSPPQSGSYPSDPQSGADPNEMQPEENPNQPQTGPFGSQVQTGRVPSYPSQQQPGQPQQPNPSQPHSGQQTGTHISQPRPNPSVPPSGQDRVQPPQFQTNRVTSSYPQRRPGSDQTQARFTTTQRPVQGLSAPHAGQDNGQQPQFQLERVTWSYPQQRPGSDQTRAQFTTTEHPTQGSSALPSGQHRDQQPQFQLERVSSSYPQQGPGSDQTRAQFTTTEHPTQGSSTLPSGQHRDQQPQFQLERVSSSYPQLLPGSDQTEAQFTTTEPPTQGIPLPGSGDVRPNQPPAPQGQGHQRGSFTQSPRRPVTTARVPISVTGTSTTPGEDSRRTLYEIVEEPALLIRGRPVKLTKIFDLFHKAGLEQILLSPGPTTVFLPSDDAFSALPKGVVDQLEENPELLRQVLSYHITNTEIFPSAQSESYSVPSLEGTQLVITMLNGGRLILISGAKAVAVTKANNGIFYVINQLLYPLPHHDIVGAIQSRPDLSTLALLLSQSGLNDLLQGAEPHTLLAPTDNAFAQLSPAVFDELSRNTTALRDVLLNHVIDGAHYGREFLTGGTFPSARGGKLKFQVVSYGYQVNEINIKTPEIVTGTGVIHLIDQVLLEDADLRYFTTLENALGDGTLSNNQQPGTQNRQSGINLLDPGTVPNPPNAGVRQPISGHTQVGGLQPSVGGPYPVGRVPSQGYEGVGNLRTQGQPQNFQPGFGNRAQTNVRTIQGQRIPGQPASASFGGRSQPTRGPGQPQSSGQSHGAENTCPGCQDPSTQPGRPTQGHLTPGHQAPGQSTIGRHRVSSPNQHPQVGTFVSHRQPATGSNTALGVQGNAPSAGQPNDVADLARSMGLNKFANWISNTGLLEKVHDGGVYTVFAPTDDAVNSLPEDMVQSIESNPEQVKSILQYHIIPQRVNLNSVRNEETTSTLLQGKAIRFNVYPNAQPDCKQIVTASGTPVGEALATMGSVQVIPVTQVLYQPTGDLLKIIEASPILQQLNEAVKSARVSWMLSGTGPITIFAPSDTAFASLTEEQRKSLLDNKQAFTDLLKRHMVRGTMFSTGIQEDVEKKSDDQKAVKLSLQEGILTVNSVPVTYADITATNGVLHVIDQFL